MDYMLLAGSVLAAVLNNIFLHTIREKKYRYDQLFFNGVVALIWAVIFVVFCALSGQMHFSTYTWLFGILYGVALAGFFAGKNEAMATGPVSLTALIGSGSFILTTAFNALYWREAVGLPQMGGIVLMLLAIFLVTFQSGGTSEPLSVRWKLYCVLFFVMSATVGVIFKFHQSYDSANTNEMMLISALTSWALLFTLYLLKRRKAAAETAHPPFAVKMLPLTLLCGLTGCVYNRMNISLSGMMPNAIFFPVFNGALIMLSAIGGMLLFREKLSKRQLLGELFGALAICLISNFFGLIG